MNFKKLKLLHTRMRMWPVLCVTMETNTAWSGNKQNNKSYLQYQCICSSHFLPRTVTKAFFFILFYLFYLIFLVGLDTAWLTDPRSKLISYSLGFNIDRVIIMTMAALWCRTGLGQEQRKRCGRHTGRAGNATREYKKNKHLEYSYAEIDLMRWFLLFFFVDSRFDALLALFESWNLGVESQLDSKWWESVPWVGSLSRLRAIIFSSHDSQNQHNAKETGQNKQCKANHADAIKL